MVRTTSAQECGKSSRARVVANGVDSDGLFAMTTPKLEAPA
jgi:hypothetical protein